ncbi:MAG: DUF3179 domain-containing (seleno)protein [Candidatus Limnocylindria bacterium]
MRLIGLIALVTLVTACTTAVPDLAPRHGRGVDADASPAPQRPWPSAPEAPTGDLDPEVSAALDDVISSFAAGSLDAGALQIVAASRDARLAWVISDVLRFVPNGFDEQELVQAFAQLTAVDPRADDRFGAVSWLAVTNLLIAWDLPAPPSYREHKADLFLLVEPAWAPFFADEASAIDWRWVSWGGVLIDDRPSGDPNPCPHGCIPALDDPALTSAADGAWYADDKTVFGVTVNDEAVALPKHIMEVHEMVNLTIGGRRVGMPYCTLCGSAQAYLTDTVPAGVETPVLRTSGLLSRSNKVMYDLVTDSVFNTFTGRAISGPLHNVGLVLEQTTVVVTTWGKWKETHPDTRIVAEDGGIGRSYPDDPLGGRDDDGPIFPIGQADPRLPAHAQVLGVIVPKSGAVAFPVEQVAAELAAGGEVTLGVIEVTDDAGGLRARLQDGSELSAHQAFWFAWSQFHPSTAVWSGILSSGQQVDEVDGPNEPQPAAATPGMCSALAGLAELESQLNDLRQPAATADEVPAVLTTLSRLRSLVASTAARSAGAALRQPLLESLDAIGAHLRSAIAIAADDEREASLPTELRTIPFITTDRVERALQAAMSTGFRC